MKNLVLIDFSLESMHALDYAIGFSKATKSQLELINVSSKEKWQENLNALEKLKAEKDTDDFKLEVHEMVGNLEDTIPDYINYVEKIGFVFIGTHDQKFLEKFFESRSMRLMNESNAHFVFIPKNIKGHTEVNKIVIPITKDKHTLQSLRLVKYLARYMKFHINFTSFTSKDSSEKQVINSRIKMAMSVANIPNVDYELIWIGDSEGDLRKGLMESSNKRDADLMVFVNTMKTGDDFNFTSKGFIENVIRNKEGIPVIAVKNLKTDIVESGGFHSTGG